MFLIVPPIVNKIIQYNYRMINQVQRLRKQIDDLRLEREHNGFQQSNLQKQISILLTDNQLLHKQLNHLILSQSSQLLKQSHDRQFTPSESNNLESQAREVKSYQFQNASHHWKKRALGAEGDGQKYQSSVPEQIYKQRITYLQTEITQLTKQNQKLCEVNDKIISNFSELKESFQEFQEKQGKGNDVKELERQVEYLTDELDSIININHSLNEKYSKLKEEMNRQKHSWADNNPESHAGNFNRRGSQQEKPKSYTIHNTHSQGPPLPSRNNNIKFQDHSRSSGSKHQERILDDGLEKEYVTFNKFYPKTNPGPNKLEESKQESVSQVETLVQLAHKLENELKTSQNLYYQLSGNQRVLPQVRQPLPQRSTWTPQGLSVVYDPQRVSRMSEEDYYRWMSYQERIRYLSNENNQLRMWENQRNR